MSTKINKLLQNLPPGVVATQRWLTTQHVDARLADKYVRAGWLTRVGHGAFARAGAEIDWPGALSALQHQLHLGVRPGGVTALALRGYAHYLALGSRELVLFGPPKSKLPTWFREGAWSRPIRYIAAHLFTSDDESSSQVTVQGVDIDVPVLERAALEMMYLVPNHQSYEEAFQVMQSLTALRPDVVQRYLEACRSIKAKRLFMHVAERLEHSWLQKLTLTNVNFGSGPRTIHAGGQLNSTYHLVVNDETPY